MAYKRLRQRRINRLIEYGFSKQEARQFTALRTVYPDGTVRVSSIILNRPYTRLMMRERVKRYRQAKKEGISDTAFRRMIAQEYVDKGWLDKEGNPDYWKVYRHYYREAIRLGLYTPPPKRYDPNKPHKKLGDEGIDREHVKKQAAKYRARAKTKTKAQMGDKSEWIQQLKKSMSDAKTPEQKEQFASQIRKLGGTP